MMLLLEPLVLYTSAELQLQKCFAPLPPHNTGRREAAVSFTDLEASSICQSRGGTASVGSSMDTSAETHDSPSRKMIPREGSGNSRHVQVPTLYTVLLGEKKML